MDIEQRYLNGCHGKTPLTQQLAVIRAERLSHVAYRCEFCPGWHTGGGSGPRPKRTGKQKRQRQGKGPKGQKLQRLTEKHNRRDRP